MAGLSVNLGNVKTYASSFPDGTYSARIASAKLDVSKTTGNPMIVLGLEVFHPTLGTAEIRDWLALGFETKIKAFYQAVNGFSYQELQDDLARSPDIELVPDEMVGAEVIVAIGDRPTKEDPSKVYKNVVEPFYFPASRIDLLAWQDSDTPF